MNSFRAVCRSCVEDAHSFKRDNTPGGFSSRWNAIAFFSKPDNLDEGIKVPD